MISLSRKSLVAEKIIANEIGERTYRFDDATKAKNFTLKLKPSFAKNVKIKGESVSLIITPIAFDTTSQSFTNKVDELAYEMGAKIL